MSVYHLNRMWTTQRITGLEALKLQSAGYRVLAVEPNIDTDGRCSVVGIDAALNQQIYSRF